MNAKLATSALVSTLLHAGLIGTLLWAVQPPAAPPTNDRLVVELYGMISERQTAQRNVSETPPPDNEPAPEPKPAPPQPAPPQSVPEPAPPEQPPPQPSPPPPRPERPKSKPQPKPQPKPQTPPPPKPQYQTQSPVQVPEQDPQPQAEAPAPPAPHAAPTPAPTAPAPQPQQRLNVPIDEQTLLKQYLGRLSKKVQEHLVYPDELKKSGHEGNTTVRFVLARDGTIQPGSLQIARSSGVDALDANALQSIQNSAPFEPPPRQITLSIGVAFSQAPLIGGQRR